MTESLPKSVMEERAADIKEITLEMAEKMLEAAERWAINAGVPCSIAIVDKAGALVAFHDMDDSLFGTMTPDIAISKAQSAVFAGASNYLLSKLLDPRHIGPIPGSYYIGLLTALKGRLNMVPGGEPIRDNDMNVIGGVGVSGVPDGVGEKSDMTVCNSAIFELFPD